MGIDRPGRTARPVVTHSMETSGARTRLAHVLYVALALAPVNHQKFEQLGTAPHREDLPRSLCRRQATHLQDSWALVADRDQVLKVGTGILSPKDS
jgi:hypothetical protein